MPLPSYQTVPLPPFSAVQSAAMGQSADFERVLNLLHEVDERVAELYPQLSDHWLQSELYAFLHIKDDLVGRVKKRATRKLSVAAGAAERRKELRVSTATAAAAAVGAAAASLTSPDGVATEIAKGAVPQTPANEVAAATPARHSNRPATKLKASVGNKQRMSAALKEMAGEEADDAATVEPSAIAAAMAAVSERDEEAKEAEVISPLPLVARLNSTVGAMKGRPAAVSTTGKQQKTESKRLTASHSQQANAVNASSIPVFTASAATASRKKAAVPAFPRKGVRSAIDAPAPGQTARVLQEEHAELAVKLDELQTRQKQLADKQDKYIRKREREDEEKRRKEEEAVAAAALVAAQETALQLAAQGAAVEMEADSSEVLRAPPSPSRLAPLPLEGSTSQLSPRHTPTSSMSNALSPLSSSRPLRPHSPSLPPLSAAVANLPPATARVAAAPLSARDYIVQPAAYMNDEAQRGTVCTGLLLCAPTPRLLLRPSTQEMKARLSGQPQQDSAHATGQPVEAELDSSADEPLAEQGQSSSVGETSSSQLEESEQTRSTVLRSALHSANRLTVDVLSTTPSLPAGVAGSSLSPASSQPSSPLSSAALRTLRPSTAEISNSAAVVTSPPTPSGRSRMVHRAGQQQGSMASPASPAGMAPSSARSRATSGETPKAVYEESFPTIGSRPSIHSDETAVVAETVKGLGNLVENNRVEAAVEAAEERIKKERWMAVMRDIERRSRRGGDTDEADDEAARQRRKWKDESLITASDLRRQIALMGFKIDEADEKGAAFVGDKRISLTSAVNPLDVPLPATARTARTARSPRPTSSASAMTEATQERIDDNSNEQQPQPSQSTNVLEMSALPAVDPLVVPLPPTSRTAVQTARTNRTARAMNETATAESAAMEAQHPLQTDSVDPLMVPLPPTSRTAAQTARTSRTVRRQIDDTATAESAAMEAELQQPTESDDVTDVAAATETETEQVEELPSPADGQQTQQGARESLVAVQTAVNADGIIHVHVEAGTESTESMESTSE